MKPQPLPLLPCILLLLLLLPTLISPQSTLCRSSCGSISIHYPFGIDPGCGSPYYQNLLTCSSSSSQLHFRTPSGTYPVQSINYADPHIIITDPSMWSCHPTSSSPPTPFSLDTSTHFSLSTKNDYLFFNCNPDHVIIEPKPSFCERFPDRCEAACDSAAYLCRNLPGCPERGREASCCSYFPTAAESLRLMTRHCESYASVYWKNFGGDVTPYDQRPEFGVRVDFEIPVTTRCLLCQDLERGGGTCGFETEGKGFLCLCDGGNVTSYCSAGRKVSSAVGVVAATTTVVSVAGLAGGGALVWYLRKMRSSKVVTCGVQSNENRVF